MSKVRSSDTKPEWILRCGLHRLGFRYRLNSNHLPGRPDLVFSKYQAVVFVHGCFWHRHRGCKDATMPKTNQAYWEKKFSENRDRDRRVFETLSRQGWKVIIVWECDLKKTTVETIEKVASGLWENLGFQPGVQYRQTDLNRGKILKIAEGRVRYRLDSYGVEDD